MTKTTAAVSAAIQIKDVKTDKYANEIPPLSKPVFKELKQSIAKNKLRYAIAINQHGDVLDGHHRYRACQELGIEPKFEVIEFANESEEIRFVHEMNRIRRHMNDYQRIEDVLRMKERLEEVAKRNMSVGGRGVKDFTPLGRVNEELAKEAKDVSHMQVHKVRKIVEKAPEELKEKLRTGEATIDNAYKKVRQLEDDNKPELPTQEWAKKLEGKSDLERFNIFGTLDFRNVKPFDIDNVWYFHQNDSRLGQPHDGQIPGQIAMNILYLYTKQGDLVIDPFAGGGSTKDACLVMGRECKAYDLEPMRKDIVKRDVREGFAEEAKDCNLVFLDPPYGDILKKEYSEQSISNLNLEDFMKIMQIVAKDSFSVLKPGGHVALVMKAIKDKDWKYTIDLPFKCLLLFEGAGFREIDRISVPLTTQSENPSTVLRLRETKSLYTRNRDLIILKKEAAQEQEENDADDGGGERAK